MASGSNRKPVCKKEMLPYMLSIGNEEAWAVTKVNNDAMFNQAFALTLLSDQVALVRLPRKPKKAIVKHDIEHTANGMLWCGPAAVSALTGACTATIRDLIKKYRKNPSTPVTGTRIEDLEYALLRLGHKVENAYLYGGKQEARPTFSQWMKDTEDERIDGLAYLISVSGPKKDNCGHWAVIVDNEYICSHTGKWVPLDKAKFKRRRVDEVYVVRRVK